MMNKDVITLLTEIVKIRQDLDAMKTSEASLAEILAYMAGVSGAEDPSNPPK